jgi:hypothetical protein
MAWLLLQQVLEMDNRRPILAAAMRCSGIGKSIGHGFDALAGEQAGQRDCCRNGNRTRHGKLPGC